jgi:hypothetical protein
VNGELIINYWRRCIYCERLTDKKILNKKDLETFAAWYEDGSLCKDGPCIPCEDDEVAICVHCVSKGSVKGERCTNCKGSGAVFPVEDTLDGDPEDDPCPECSGVSLQPIDGKPGWYECGRCGATVEYADGEGEEDDELSAWEEEALNNSLEHALRED